MTDSDLRELDGWIAEKFLGWKQIEDGKLWRTPDDENGKGVTFRYPFKFSSDVVAFALVKREIERRGWDWEVLSSGGVPTEKRFRFVIALKDHSRVRIKIGESGSEELAGCLAVKSALEVLGHG